MERLLRKRADARTSRKSLQAGFTLVEILIVLAIVGLLFSFVGVNVIKKYKGAQRDAAKIQIASFQQALQAFYLAHNVYPTTAQGLDALVRKPSGGPGKFDNYPDGGYLSKKEVPKDPWGNAYIYESENGQDFTITSVGPDGEPGTEDDIKSE